MNRPEYIAITKGKRNEKICIDWCGAGGFARSRGQ